MRRSLPGLAVLILAAGASPAGAWTPAMDERVAREALRLMPSSLRGVLSSHIDSLAAGARGAAAEEPSAFHELDPNQAAPSAASRLAELIPQTVAAIDEHRPFSEVAFLLGRIAHYTGDVNNPLAVASEDPREGTYALAYTAYVEDNLPKYPLVFYGWADPILDTAGRKETVRTFAERSARRARDYYASVRAAYDPANRKPKERRFDDRSLPFGVGSLSWSRTVTDTARLWLHVWKEARGDLKGTPYRTPGSASSAAGQNR